MAKYRVGDSVPLVFNPNRPSQAYRFTFWDIWNLPLLVLVLQVSVLSASFREAASEDSSPATEPSPATEFGRLLKGR